MPAWLVGLLAHWGTKTVAIILLVSTISLGAFTIYRGIVNKAYSHGYQDALHEHPANTYNGPTTVIQGIPMWAFPFKLGRHWAIGLCHD